MLFQKRHHATVLLARLALAQIRETKPVPVVISHKFAQDWFVSEDILLECSKRIRMQVHVGKRMIAQWKTCIAPELQNLLVFRRRFGPLGIHKSIHRRRLSGLKRLDNALGDVHASHTGRKSGVGGQIVKGERDLLCFGDSAPWIREQCKGKSAGHGRKACAPRQSSTCGLPASNRLHARTPPVGGFETMPPSMDACGLGGHSA